MLKIPGQHIEQLDRRSRGSTLGQGRGERGGKGGGSVKLALDCLTVDKAAGCFECEK